MKWVGRFLAAVAIILVWAWGTDGILADIKRGSSNFYGWSWPIWAGVLQKALLCALMACMIWRGRYE